jgi:hypothetical protein
MSVSAHLHVCLCVLYVSDSVCKCVVCRGGAGHIRNPGALSVFCVTKYLGK